MGNDLASLDVIFSICEPNTPCTEVAASEKSTDRAYLRLGLPVYLLQKHAEPKVAAAEYDGRCRDDNVYPVPADGGDACLAAWALGSNVRYDCDQRKEEESHNSGP